tara:strand:+ start:389 stop:1159 length:771 start_codon:yes stop_codon:yes gene_type:complete
MSREFKSKSRGCYQAQGKTQSLILSGTALNAVAPLLSATPQKAIMLGVLNIESTQLGNVTDITVMGERLMVSNASAPLEMFSNATTDPRETYAGFTIGGGKNANIQVQLAAVGNTSFGWFCDPISKEVANEAEGEFANWIYGLGSVNIPFGTSAVLVGVSNRPCTLGQLILANHSVAAIPSSNLLVTSVVVAGDELLAGDGTQQVPLSAFQNNSQASTGLDLNYRIPYNANVTITIQNVDAALLGTVAGGVFCRAY